MTWSELSKDSMLAKAKQLVAVQRERLQLASTLSTVASFVALRSVRRPVATS